MNAGDRVLITIGDSQYMCAVVESESKSQLILVSEDGEQIAKIHQFWRKTKPVFDGTIREKHVEVKLGLSAGKPGVSIKCCEAPGCGAVYNVKRSDLARGWGKTCSKSCAAKLREFKRK
ncbi:MULTISPECIES: hypothetical protein [Gammaproteobacteria]|uniref:hypothetical protein n=1 Tax=Gammaproteobacteria TaxID=1236 RepID=UPI002FC85F54